jgi:hypothetical protein
MAVSEVGSFKTLKKREAYTPTIAHFLFQEENVLS